MTDEPDKISDRVEKMVTINFSVTKCPLEVYKKFTAFCKEECNENYSFGLKLLIDRMETNAKEAVLFDQFLQLKDEVAALKSENKEDKLKIKTMGMS